MSPENTLSISCTRLLSRLLNLEMSLISRKDRRNFSTYYIKYRQVPVRFCFWGGGGQEGGQGRHTQEQNVRGGTSHTGGEMLTTQGVPGWEGDVENVNNIGGILRNTVQPGSVGAHM